MASLTKQIVLCLILFFCLSSKISLASPIYDSHAEPNDDYRNSFDSNYDNEEDYDYDTAEVNTTSRYNCPGQVLFVPIDGLCDGFPDCDDESDESRTVCEEYQVEFVETTTHPSFVGSVSTPNALLENPERCSLTEFQCPSETGLCIPRKAICDGTGDCPEGEDELFCGTDNAFDSNSASRFGRSDISSSPGEDWTFDRRSHSALRPERPHHHRRGKLFRLFDHSQRKMRKSTQHSDLPNKEVGNYKTAINSRETTSENTLFSFDNRLFAFHETGSDSTFRHDKAELNSVLRQLPINRERNGSKTEIAGESGETIATSSYLETLSDEEAENYLRSRASSSSVERKDNQDISNNSSTKLLTFHLQKHHPLSSSAAEASQTSIEAAQPKKTNHEHGHKKKLKNSISALIRRFGKILGSSSDISKHDMSISINIRNSQKTIGNRDTAQESNEQSENEPRITVKLEMTL